MMGLEHEMANPATVDIIPAPAGITPKALQTPRAAGLAGVLFAVLFAVIVILLRKVVPTDPPYSRGVADQG